MYRVPLTTIEQKRQAWGDQDEMRDPLRGARGVMFGVAGALLLYAAAYGLIIAVMVLVK